MAKKKQFFSNLTLLAMEAALQAGEILRRGFGTSFEISKKSGKHNLVTEYDHKAEKWILNFLKQYAPGSTFLAEETGASGKKHSPLLWIIDPLDGTVNFAHGIPLFSVSIGAHLHGKPHSGVVYQPMTHELFVAEAGKGAFLDGKPIHVSHVKKLDHSMLCTGFPYNLSDNPNNCIDHLVDILKVGIPIRRLGSAAIDLAYTAAGRVEGFFESSLAPWDCAAGALLVEEAGGTVSDWSGKPHDIHGYGPIFASNGKIHKETTRILSRDL